MSAFMFGREFGVSSCTEEQCDVCRKIHNKGIGDESDNWVRREEFAGMNICECCFKSIEKEILFRMEDILKWYRKILLDSKLSGEKMSRLIEGL